MKHLFSSILALCMTAASQAAVVTALDMTTNGGINPATGVAWQTGDTYRLVFVTSTTTDATSTSIATYNTFVNNVADTSTIPTLGTVNWSAIVSTAAVNANTNTGTASAGNVAIFLVDGTTIVANTYTDLWDGTIDASISRDENNAARTASSVWTGSISSGTKDTRPNGPLGTGTPAIGSSNSATAAWIVNGTRIANTNSYPVYALSAPITIIPEPGAALIGSLGMLALLRRRRN